MRASFRSKLPDVGTTIFTVMSRRARELGALNLGQGFPDYPIDPRLTELVAEALGPGPQPVRPYGGPDRAAAAHCAETPRQLRTDRGSGRSGYRDGRRHRGDL